MSRRLRSRRPAPGLATDELAPWTEVLWPVLAGAVTAVGLVGLGRAAGWPKLALAYGCASVLVALCAFATFADMPMTWGRALRIGLTASLVTVVILGLGLLSPLVGWAAAAFTAVTSPPVTTRLGRRGPVARTTSRRWEEDGVACDQRLVDEEFLAIVARLEQDHSDGSDAV